MSETTGDDIPPEIRDVILRSRMIRDRDFGGLPIETGVVARGLGADHFTDAELWQYVARHRGGDFGEDGRFDDCEIDDGNRNGDIEHLSRAQLNRLRIELRLPHDIRSRYRTDKGTLYVSTFTSSRKGRMTTVYGPEGL